MRQRGTLFAVCMLMISSHAMYGMKRENLVIDQRLLDAAKEALCELEVKNVEKSNGNDKQKNAFIAPAPKNDDDTKRSILVLELTPCGWRCVDYNNRSFVINKR
jgi:hypothetical protein